MIESPQVQRPDALARMFGGVKATHVEELPNGTATFYDLPVERAALAARYARWQNRMWARLLAKGGFPSMLVDPQWGGVGDSGVPTRTQVVVFQISLTPASVATIVCAEQALTISGILATDILAYAANSVAMATAVSATVGHVSAANTIALAYCNPTAGALVPTAGTHNIVVLRG
jgi:hypothetical protein